MDILDIAKILHNAKKIYMNRDFAWRYSLYDFVRRGCVTPKKLLESYYLRRHICFRVYQFEDSQWRPTDIYSIEPLLGDHLRTGHQSTFDATSVVIKDGDVLLEDKTKKGYLYIDTSLLNKLK